MYSITFAIIVISAIAVCNLFLGFASALLIGRGPRSWAEVDQRIQIRWLRRSTEPSEQASPVDLAPLAASGHAAAETGAPPATARVTADSPPSQPAADADRPTSQTPADPSRTSANAPGGAARDPSQPVKMQVSKPRESDAELPPQLVLERQLTAWQSDNGHTERPSAAMLSIQIIDDNGASDALPLVMDAIDATVRGQLRRDRRVVRPSPQQIVWFADDMEVLETLTPVERIRQLISKTHFAHDGQAIDLNAHAAVVKVDSDDSPVTLLQRLTEAIKLAMQAEALGTVVDEGDGPRNVDLDDYELDEVDCDV